MSPKCGFINTPKLKFCVSSSKTQVQQFKKGCLKWCYTRLNHECKQQDSTYSWKDQFALQDSSCETQLPKIFKLMILASKSSSSSTKVINALI